MKLYKLHEAKTIYEMETPNALVGTPDDPSLQAGNPKYQELDKRMQQMEKTVATQAQGQPGGQGNPNAALGMAQNAKLGTQSAEVGAKHVNAPPQPAPSTGALF